MFTLFKKSTQTKKMKLMMKSIMSLFKLTKVIMNSFLKYKERVQKLIATKGSIPECRDGKFNFWLYKYYIEYCLTVVFLFCCF